MIVKTCLTLALSLRVFESRVKPTLRTHPYSNWKWNSSLVHSGVLHTILWMDTVYSKQDWIQHILLPTFYHRLALRKQMLDRKLIVVFHLIDFEDDKPSFWLLKAVLVQPGASRAQSSQYSWLCYISAAVIRGGMWISFRNVLPHWCCIKRCHNLEAGFQFFTKRMLYIWSNFHTSGRSVS